MPRPFHRLDASAFERLLALYPMRRRITGVHLHHTWRPRKSQFRGVATIDGMWRFHTQEMEWSDIAQHLTVDPDGDLWTGRDWNRSPASATGNNGSVTHGPFMIEMIGDFDLGEERLEGDQRRAVVDALALLHRRFDLDPASLAFHRQMSTKTCPGSGIDRDELLAEVRVRLDELASGAEAGDGARNARAEGESVEPLFAPNMHEVYAETERLILHLTGSGASRTREPVDEGELPEEQMGLDEVQSLVGPEAPAAAATGGGGRSAGHARVELTGGVLAPLRAHVVNLRQGRFSKSGLFQTGSGDVDRIFEEHLPRWRADHADSPLRLLLYAHGGLVSERSGLGIAHRHVEWWKDNGVYPIYFIWETGLLETLRQLLKAAWDRIRGAGRRDLFDFTTDPLVEVTARALGGVHVWAGMKRSAERSSDTDGGANHLIKQLRAYLRKNEGDAVEIHAVGHSAGAVFHSHFVPKLVERDGPRVEGLHLLAPAVRVDEFQEQVAPLLGGKVGHLTLFAMDERTERADQASPVYRKSLLYLVRRALETERFTPILGLAADLRRDDGLRRLFDSGRAEALFSPSQGVSGRRATTSKTHGGFDDDRPTMESVLRRVRGLDDDDPIVRFPEPMGGERAVGDEEDLMDLLGGDEELELALALIRGGAGGGGGPSSAVTAPAPAAAGPGRTTAAAPVPADQGPAAAGGRRALCVGIDDYPTAPLDGCVNDAQTWGRTLTGLGFQVSYLRNGEATEARILGELRALVTSGRPGDVLVFQYAGHGTQLPDFDGDEMGRDTDQALVPADYQSGATVVDDELARVYDLLPAGVNLTIFMDCCHSGANNRLLLAGLGAGALGTGGYRRRFIEPNPEMLEAHRRRASARGAAPTARSGVGREVLFAACEPWESALELGGQGLFTGHATPLVADAVAGGWTHVRLMDRIQGAFGANPPQRPRLDGRTEGRVLEPVGGGAGSAGVGGGTSAVGGAADLSLLTRRLEELIGLLQGGRR